MCAQISLDKIYCWQTVKCWKTCSLDGSINKFEIFLCLNWSPYWWFIINRLIHENQKIMIFISFPLISFILAWLANYANFLQGGGFMFSIKLVSQKTRVALPRNVLILLVKKNDWKMWVFFTKIIRNKLLCSTSILV